MSNIFESSNKTSGIIKNEEALSYDYVPKKLPFREGQVDEIADAIKPLVEGHKGTNLFISGAPGIGKTASVKWILRELSDYSDDVIPIYINCWNFRTKYFIFMEMANKINVSFTMGKSSEHVLQQVRFKLREKKVVFVFDEIDKVEDSDFLYQVVSLFPESCIMLISNSADYLFNVEPRIKSRLMARTVSFKPYSLKEVQGILKERAGHALRSSSLPVEILKQIAVVTNNKKDIRVGLFLLRESAKSAESDNRRKINEKDVKALISQLDNVVIGNVERLSEDENRILDAVKNIGGGISGEVFEEYQTLGGKLSYRSFKRYVKKLAKLDLIEIKETGGGFKGQSTKISLK